jgi:hypothetical protein
MGISTTILFYLLFGAGVSATLALTSDRGTQGGRAFQAVTALAFWPLFVPGILWRRGTLQGPIERPDRPEEQADALAAAIFQVERELDAATQSLDGWAEDVLLLEQDRFSELRAAWRTQADRIRDLDQLLKQSEFSASEGAVDVAGKEVDSGNEALRLSAQARMENIRKLHDVRNKLANDLAGTLAWVRELVTMIHLAKFTGAPPSRADELVTQIAAAVEGLSEATRLRQEIANVR